MALTADLGVGPSRSLMVGDKTADIKTGRGAGAFTAAVTYGYGDLDSLTGRPRIFSPSGFPNCPTFWPGEAWGAVRASGSSPKNPGFPVGRAGKNPPAAEGRGPQFCLTEPALLNIFP